jgi:hypothetical protein
LPDSFIQKVQTQMTTEPFFAIYAASQSWTAVHLGQFIGMVIITFGLVALFFALDVRTGVELWLNRLALLSAGAGMALYGVLQAVMRRCGRSPWAGDASAGCPTAKSILLGDT